MKTEIERYENYRAGLTQQFDQDPTFAAAVVEVVIQEIQAKSGNLGLVNELHKIFPFKLAPVADPPKPPKILESKWTLANYNKEARRRPARPKRRPANDTGEADEPLLLSKFFENS